MSKKLVALFFAAIVLAQCTENKVEQTAAEEAEIVLISEELKPYALTVIDSVYSVYIKLSSADSAIAQYNVQLIQGTEIFEDSLVFSIPAGQVVAGEFIFPACRVKNQTKPSLTSNLKRLHDK